MVSAWMPTPACGLQGAAQPQPLFGHQGPIRRGDGGDAVLLERRIGGAPTGRHLRKGKFLLPELTFISVSGRTSRPYFDSIRANPNVHSNPLGQIGSPVSEFINRISSGHPDG